MERRRLSDRGPRTSVFGLGLAALGRPGYLNLGHHDDLPADRSVESVRRHAFTVLDAAADAGITYFDAARSYGRAEEFLAGWLEHIPTAGIVVGSKWGYTYTAGWQADADVHEVKDHSAGTFDRQWEESRAQLGSLLALYQIHSATLDSGVLGDRVVLERLAGIRDDVLVGLSVSGPGQAAAIERALEIEIDGVRLFDTVQATWNLLERSAEPALASAAAAGLGVIVKEGVANGRLTERNHSLPASVAAAARQRGVGPDAIALAAAADRPWATVVLSGAATPAHLKMNLEALQVDDGLVVADQTADAIEPAEEYWGFRSVLPWT